jgi:hypothetical protein
MFTEKYIRPNAKIVSTVDQWKIYRDGNELFAIYSKPSQDVHRHTGWVSSVSEIKNKYIVKKVIREMHRLFEDMNGQVEQNEGQVELESNDDGANDVTGSGDDEIKAVDEEQVDLGSDLDGKVQKLVARMITDFVEYETEEETATSKELAEYFNRKKWGVVSTAKQYGVYESLMEKLNRDLDGTPERIQDMTFEQAVQNMNKLALRTRRGTMADGGGTNFRVAIVWTENAEDFEEYVGRTNGEIYSIEEIGNGKTKVKYFEGEE